MRRALQSTLTRDSHTNRQEDIFRKNFHGTTRAAPLPEAAYWNAEKGQRFTQHTPTNDYCQRHWQDPKKTSATDCAGRPCQTMQKLSWRKLLQRNNVFGEIASFNDEICNFNRYFPPHTDLQTEKKAVTLLKMTIFCNFANVTVFAKTNFPKGNITDASW